MVWGHLNIPLPAETLIYSFHLPLFFFISGLLYKHTDRTFLETAKRKATTLLVPYLIFALISMPIGILKAQYIDHTPIDIGEIILNFFFLNGSVGWNAPIWFLVALFITDMIAFVITKTKDNPLVWLGLFVLLGYQFSATGIEYPFALHAACWGVVFYLAGMLVKKYDLVSKIGANLFSWLGSMSVLAAVSVWFGLILNPRISVYHNNLGDYWYFLIAAIAGCLFATLLFSKLPSSKLLVIFGQNTLLILATQYILFLGFTVIDQLLLGTNYLQINSYKVSIILTVVTMISYLPLSYVFNRFFPESVGKQRD